MIEYNKENIVKFIGDITDIIFRHNCSVTSWIRSEHRNNLLVMAGTGAIPDSQHKKGTAIDIVPDLPESKPMIIKEATDLGYVAFGYLNKPHVHIQMFKKKV